MKVIIESHWGNESWSGNIDLDEPAKDSEALLEDIFRFFNRVFAADNERLERIGYRLPSLSVDDVVELPDREERWICRSVGWEQVS